MSTRTHMSAKMIPSVRVTRGEGPARSASVEDSLERGDQTGGVTSLSVGKKNHASTLLGGKHASKRFPRLLSKAEQHALAIRIKAGDPVARETMIVANLRLVAKIARGYFSSGATMDDLIQEGCRGLIEAVQRYDPEKHDTLFSTYASYWIRNKIQRAVAANFSLIRMPDYMFRLNVKSHKANGEPRNSNRNEPIHQELILPAEHAGITKRQHRLLNQSMILQSSYHKIDDISDGIDLAEAATSRHCPGLALESEERLDKVQMAIQQLTPLEAWLIRRHFGLVDSHEHSFPAVSRVGKAKMAAVVSRAWTYARIGRELGISVHRVRQIEHSALRKLRISLQSYTPSTRLTDDKLRAVAPATGQQSKNV